MKRYSRDTQEFIYVLLGSISNHLHEKKADAKTTENEMYTTKNKVKKEYIKILSYKGKKEPLETFYDDIGTIYDSILENEPVELNRRKLFQESVTELTAKELQKFFLKYGDFSLALSMMSQEAANKFVQFLLDYHYSNEIEFKSTTIKYLNDKELEKHVWWCIMKRRCCISGKYGADLHHVDSVASIGGYEHCNGLKTRFMSLDRQYHNEVGVIGQDSFDEKYLVKGVWLKEKDVEFLVNNNIYPNQFKGYKK